MKPLLQVDRATSAVPALFSRLARAGAWARESLVARGIAVLLGLGVLAMIGGSALAGNGAAKTAPASAPEAPSSAPAAPKVEKVDAGAVPLTRPELLPVAPSESVEATASATPPPNVARATPDDPVDLNTARVEDLRRLPGVGAKRAEAILALRARLPGGRFRQIEDLLKVKGVGRAMLKRLHPLIRIS
jgi:competence protein ComEA